MSTKAEGGFVEVEELLQILLRLDFPNVMVLVCNTMFGEEI